MEAAKPCVGWDSMEGRCGLPATRPDESPRFCERCAARAGATLASEPGPVPLRAARGNAGRRRFLAAAVLALVVAAAIVGALVGRLIDSPGEVAARTAAPTAAPILVPAEQRLLSTDVVTRGTARFGSPRGLSLAPTSLKAESRIITSLPPVGAELTEGDVVLTVSGRPVFLLVGERPSYRDLGRGIVGEDVRQLEEALAHIGIDPGPRDGVFDRRTSRAVVRLYARAKAEPIRATEAQLAEVRPPEAELTEGARAQPGVQVPADELIFVPSAPVRVTELIVEPGSQPDGVLITGTDLLVAVDSSLPLEEVSLVAAGMEAQLDEPDLGIDARGVVSRVAEAPGTDGVDGFHVYLEVRVDDAPPNLVGASVRVTIPIESTSDKVLAVPVSALSLGADGSTRVQVSTERGLLFVEVEPGLAADGFVEVTPLEGALEPGELVVIGFEQSASSG